VPPTFAAPGPPRVGAYVWNILEPTILAPDYQALLDRDGARAPVTITSPQDYGELKRHEWEFQHHTAFAYGVLSPDKQSELGASTSTQYEGGLRRDGPHLGDEAGRRCRARSRCSRSRCAPGSPAKWPFKKVAFPGRDMPMSDWNALPTGVCHEETCRLPAPGSRPYVAAGL
jgi:hypothetical protein